jgi:hypothetical protein
VIFLVAAVLAGALVLIPAVIYMFTISSVTKAMIFLILYVIVALVDDILKPLLLGRGVAVPSRWCSSARLVDSWQSASSVHLLGRSFCRWVTSCPRLARSKFRKQARDLTCSGRVQSHIVWLAQLVTCAPGTCIGDGPGELLSLRNHLVYAAASCAAKASVVA